MHKHLEKACAAALQLDRMAQVHYLYSYINEYVDRATCIYRYTWVYAYIHIHVCAYAYVHTEKGIRRRLLAWPITGETLCIFTYMHANTVEHVYTHTHACMRIYMHICWYAYNIPGKGMRRRLLAWPISTGESLCISTHTHAYTVEHVYTHMHAYMYIYMHRCTLWHVCIRVCVYSLTCV